MVWVWRYTSPMKPKNRVMCPDCGRAKMLFETEKQANTFLKFNMNAVNPNGDKIMRVYYCPACCGYHISSHEYKGGNRTDRLIEAYHKDIEKENEEVWSSKVFDELISRNFKTRSEVVDYLKKRSDLPKKVKQKAKADYYKEKNI